MATTTSQRRSASSFLKEGLLLPIRNVRFFILPILLTITYAVASELIYSTALQPLFADLINGNKTRLSTSPQHPGYAQLVRESQTRAWQVIAAGSTYLAVTTFAIGPAVTAVTVSASVTAWSSPLQRRAAAASFKGTVFGTALLCSALHLACHGAIQALRVYIFLYHRGLLSGEILLVFLDHGFWHCLHLVTTVAIVMSAAEPVGCFSGVRALRQAWWLVLGDAAPAVVLVVMRAAAVAGLSLFEIVLQNIQFFRGMPGAAFADFIKAIFPRALHLWFACVTTVYYFRRRHPKYGDGVI